MPSRCFTSGRKFSTTTSAFFTMRLNAASPSLDFRFERHAALVAVQVLEVGALARAARCASPASGSGGNSILMTLAPQSASWRTQVGPGAHPGQIEDGESFKRARSPWKRHFSAPVEVFLFHVS